MTRSTSHLAARPAARRLWPKKHDDAFQSAGLPRPTPEDLRDFASSIGGHEFKAEQFAKLPLRAQEVIYFHTSLAIRNGDLPASEICIDVSQGIDRTGYRLDVAPCLTGSSSIYLISRQRLLLGQEALALQGMSRARCQGFRDGLMLNLAGNAFNGPCAMASLIAVLCHPQPADCPR